VGEDEAKEQREREKVQRAEVGKRKSVIRTGRTKEARKHHKKEEESEEIIKIGLSMWVRVGGRRLERERERRASLLPRLAWSVNTLKAI
jgi:hypothetical protein